MTKQETTYQRNHRRVRAARGKASEYECADCEEEAKEWSQIHNTAGDDPKHYEPRCHKCHQKYDDKWNKDQRAKVSASTKRVWDESPERRAAMIGSKRAAGKRTPEQCARIGAPKVGNKFAAGKRTPEQCERIRIARWGR
jgi:hypothetical protein